MTANVKIVSVDDVETDWEEKPVAVVGGTANLVLEFSGYTDLSGGKVRVNHPGITSRGVTVVVPDRKGTGERKGVLRRRAARPDDLSRVERVTVPVTFTTEVPIATTFALTNVKNCVVQAPTEPLRVLADDEALEAARVLVRTGYVKNLNTKLSITRAGNSGLSAQVANNVRAYTRFFGQFFFTDPDGVERTLPKGLAVKVILGEHPTNAIDAALEDDGKLTLEMIGYAEVIEKKVLTLRFGSKAKNCVVCELPAAPATQEAGDEPAETDSAGNYDKRFFKLPRQWSLRQADWTVTEHDSRWVADRGHFDMTKNGRAASLGRKDKPVKLVLDPHWQYLKFEFFDRHYGNTDHGGARKTVPPMLLVGDRSKPASPVDFKGDVKSNWWVVVGGENVQCVPWVIQRSRSGTDDKRPSRESILRFTHRVRTSVQSTSATARARVRATSKQLRPGPERLKFYDLPLDWQSRNYYAALSTTAGEFGWYEDLADKPTTKAKPLVFCLDDIVLTDQFQWRLADWDNSERMTMFINTFDATQGCSVEGVFEADADKPWLSKAPEVTAPEKDENYIVKQPKWVRLIAAQGSLFDVFDQRTGPGSTFDPDYDVIGARAAVRWVDGTGELGKQVKIYNEVTKTTSAAPDMKVVPLRYFTGGAPVETSHSFFSIQPYFAQTYPPRQAPYSDSAGLSTLGRFDMALLRCCDVGNRATPGSEVEVALNLLYHKMFFEFTVAAAGGADVYLKDYHRNVMDRWNGVTGVSGKAPLGRAKLTPDATGKKLEVTIVSFVEMTTLERAHFRIRTTDSAANGRDNRGGQIGTGETGNTNQKAENDGRFTSAHEHGHQMALPDEYNERWDGASFGQASFLQHLPGDPFEQDGRVNVFSEPDAPMMNGNYSVHNRYFWHCAEWVRRRVGYPFFVALKARPKYKVPPHATDGRAFNFWPIEAVQNPPNGLPSGTFSPGARCHLFLYALGADEFAVTRLPAKSQTPSPSPYDGIVMVAVLLKIAPPVGSDATLKQLVRQLANVGREVADSLLNYKWIATGVVRDGTPQKWTFARCLVHFAPRVVVTGPADLPRGPEWLDSFDAAFRGTAEAIAMRDKLNDYWANHADPVTREQHRVIVATVIPEPADDVRGTWDADSNNVAVTHQPRPPGFTNIDSLLGTYESTPADPPITRFKAVQAVENACKNWIGANGTSVYLAEVTALRDRAKARRLVLASLHYIREVEKTAASLATDAGKHVVVANEVLTKHAFHYEVECAFEAAKPPVWKAANPKPDLPAAAAWLNTVTPTLQAHGSVVAAHALLDAYKNVKWEERGKRIVALTTLEGPAAAPSPATTDDTNAMVFVRQLELDAKNYREYLQRTLTSTSVKITGDTADQLEAALRKVFPAMLKIDKAAGDIVAADVKTLLTPLGIQSLAVTLA